MIERKWIPCKTEYAVINDAVSGKQIADFASPELDEQTIAENMALAVAAPAMRAALARAAFLLERISEGDHQALRNTADAAKQCRSALRQAQGAA